MPKYLRIALSIFIPLALVIVSMGKNSADFDQSGRPTSFSFAPNGTRGLYTTLEVLHPDTERWTKSLVELLEQREVGTLFVFTPEVPLSASELSALILWIDLGGQLVFVSDLDWPVRTTPEVSEQLDFLEAYGIPIGVSALYPSGEGCIRVVASDTPLFNYALEKDPAAAVPIIQSVLDREGPVYFDEYHLGYGHDKSFSNLLARCLKQPWGKCLLILAIAAFFLLLHNRMLITRRQPPIPANAPSDTGAFHDLIDARSGLFEAAEATELCQESIQIYSIDLIKKERSL